MTQPPNPSRPAMTEAEREAMVALADACEKATGANRDLDAAIAPYMNLRVVDEGHPLGRCCYDLNGRALVLPRYTASLDAAMTLMDANTFFHVSRFDAEADGRSEAHVYPNRHVGDDYEAEAATPALALTAAALRARANQGTPA